ncbi:MAG: benzoyl-CoA 2,3-epoxidase subunit BoxB, partial [Myxococcales bacterium]|nr:benzoyl-CoA 2,3-epoxidase subunit BoxB [Myxococcales bacterium]
HMFVGETGIQRVLRRTCELMKKDPNQDARALGGIDLPTIQKFLNLWYSVSLDLFGGEISSNAATYFASGLKGRAHEAKKYEEHSALDQFYTMQVPKAGGGFETQEIPLRTAMNEVLRDEYSADSQRGVDKWNKTIAEAGIDFELELPSSRFHRATGIYSGLHFDPQGNLLSEDEWNAKKAQWLPTEEDDAYVRSLMTKPIYEAGKMANWIAPPPRGIKGKPVDFEYVRHDPH